MAEFINVAFAGVDACAILGAEVSWRNRFGCGSACRCHLRVLRGYKAGGYDVGVFLMLASFRCVYNVIHAAAFAAIGVITVSAIPAVARMIMSLVIFIVLGLFLVLGVILVATAFFTKFDRIGVRSMHRVWGFKWYWQLAVAGLMIRGTILWYWWGSSSCSAAARSTCLLLGFARLLGLWPYLSGVPLLQC